MDETLPSRGRTRRALAFLGPHRSAIASILVLTLGVSGIAAFEPLMLKYVVDALGAKTLSPAARGLAILVGLAVGKESLTAASNWLTWRTRIRVHYSLMEAAVTRLHSLPLSFHRAEGVGATMTRLERGVQGLVTALSEIAFNVVPALVFLGISLVLMFRLEWRLALVVLFFAPLPAVIAAFAAPAQTTRERTLMDRWMRIYSRFNEVLSGIMTVKSFAMEHREKRRFLDEVAGANRVVVRGVGMDSGVSAAQNLVVHGARLCAIGVGGWLVLEGEATLGTLIAFLGYVGALFAPVQGLTGIYKTLRTAQVSLEQVFAILDAQDDLGDAPDAVEPGTLRGDVRFDRVRFAYEPGRTPWLLDGVDLHVRPGETVAIVGPSGTGKTTLAALIQRFYDPTEGRILLDGRDVRSLVQRSLRRHIGVVLQDSLLFNESVRNNIAYGRPDASLDEIVGAARAANAHEFVSLLPEGYDTVVGERGSRLSAGERQRIAIARSLLKDPSILILDEPTSALDAESEALVQEALAKLMRGRTSFVIAHRLATVVDADRILVLRNGRITEHGTHGELVARGGYYASLVRNQTRGLAMPS